MVKNKIKKDRCSCGGLLIRVVLYDYNVQIVMKKCLNCGRYWNIKE